MSENIIPVGNSPIFDRLVREMGERNFKKLLSPKGAELLEPVKDFTPDLPKPAQEAQNMWGISALQASQNLKRAVDAMISAQVVSVPVRLSKEEAADHGIVTDPVIERNVSVEDLSAHLVSLNHVIGEMALEFEEKHPGLTPIHITRMDELDGTVTIRVRQAKLVEQTDEDVNAAPKIAVGPLSDMMGSITPKAPAGEEFVVRGEASVLPPIVKIPSSIGEDTPDVLYMKTSTWGSDEE